jgi:hypothetical protein
LEIEGPDEIASDVSVGLDKFDDEIAVGWIETQ